MTDALSKTYEMAENAPAFSIKKLFTKLKRKESRRMNRRQ
jgi:hypothetical protein